jgi:hypothetical protein
MVAHAAAASLGSMQMTAALSRGSVVPSIRRVASVRPAKRLTRARFPVVRAAQDQGPNESTEDYEARLHADATVAVERRILEVVPAELLGSIAIPQKLVEIRSYVRWEEAGKPEDTSREWQAREYQAALIDLKLEMLAGGNLNDVRRRYQLDTEFGEDSPCHSPSKTELEMLKKALAISKEPEYYADEKAQAPIDGEDAAIAMLANAASNIVAPGPAMPPAPVVAAAPAPASSVPVPVDAKKAEKLKLKAEAEAQMKKLQAQMKALEEEELETEADELAKRVAAAAATVVPPPPVPAAPPAPGTVAKPVFSPVGAATPETAGASDTSKARALSAAKAAAEAELKAAEAEMRAAQAALKAAAAKREADAKKSATVLGDELRMGHVPAEVAKSTYGVKAKAADLEAKAKAKKDAQKKVDALFIEPGVENPTMIKAEAKRLIEMELAKEEEILNAKKSVAEPAESLKAPTALKAPTPPPAPVAKKSIAATSADIKSDIPELVDDVAGEVADIEDFQPEFVAGTAVDERLAKIETLHAAQLKAVKKEHEEELLKAKLSVETDGASSSAEKQLRAKLGELVRALEVSNKQCRGLKEKLASTATELATEKKISGKAGEVLAAHKTNEMMIRTLKKELSVALEVQATAEKRAQAAEKEAAATKVDSDVTTGKSESLEERVKELEAELAEAQEVIAEFKASWEADRKVIAVLSKMKDAPDAQAKIAAAAAEESSSSSVFSKWGASLTRALVGDLAADRDVAAETLRASAIKWSPKYDAIEAEKAAAAKREAKPYARQGGSATIAMLRARKETAERAVDENARARQANWLEAAEQATEAAAAFDEEVEVEEEVVEEPEPVAAVKPVVAAVKPVAPAAVKSNAVPKAKKIPLPGDKLPPAAAPVPKAAANVPPPGANAVVKTAEDAVDIQKPPTATGKAAAPVAMPKAAAPKAAIMPKFIPASKAGDDKKDNGGWSSAHLPPTR